jgi:zinc/manganese transport system substrate-binding protein
MLRNIVKWVGRAAAVCAALSAPLATASEVTPAPLKVVASFSILADMVKQVGAEHVSVVSLVGPDGDAHMFNPSPADAKALAQADLVVINGLGFEGWIDRLIKSSGYKGRVVVASKGVTTLTHEEEEVAHGEKHHDEHKAKHDHDHDHDHKHDHAGKVQHTAAATKGHDHGDVDPHAWQNLNNGRIYALNIAQALIEARPSAADVIGQQADAYIAQIDQLEKRTIEKLSEIPVPMRRVITSHDAFEYFARAYNIRFLSLQGWTTDQDVSAADMANLIRQIKQDDVHALFLENMSDPRLLQRVAQEADVKIGGKLYADSLSPPGTAADTYLKMFDYNVNQIWMALQQ